jgi:hypothetical protein
VFVTRFSWFGRYAGIEGGLSGIPLGVFELAIVVRAVILVFCVVQWIRARHAAASPAPAPVTLRTDETLAESPSIA